MARKAIPICSVNPSHFCFFRFCRHLSDRVHFTQLQLLAALIHSHSCAPRSGGNDPLPPPRFATATATPAAAAVRGGSISSLPSIVPAPWLRTACCAGRAGQRTSSTRPADATRNQVRAWWRASPAAHYWLDGPFTRLASPQYMITGARLTRDLFFFFLFRRMCLLRFESVASRVSGCHLCKQRDG